MFLNKIENLLHDIIFLLLFLFHEHIHSSASRVQRFLFSFVFTLTAIVTPQPPDLLKIQLQNRHTLS